MNLFWKVTMLVASVVMLGSCCACRKGKNNLPLAGTQWQVLRMMGQDYAFDNDKFVFTFNDGNFSGVGACNRMMGQFATSSTGALKFQNLASTKIPHAGKTLPCAMFLPRISLNFWKAAWARQRSCAPGSPSTNTGIVSPIPIIPISKLALCAIP